MKGQGFGSERRLLTCPQTGVKIVRVSGFPVVNQHLYIHMRPFSADSKQVFFTSRRAMRRDAPSDIFRADVDGMNLTQITDADGVGWFNVSPVGQTLYYGCGNRLVAVDLESLEEHTVAEVDALTGFAGGSVSGDGTRYYTAGKLRDREGYALVEIETDGSGWRIFHEHPHPVGHIQCEPVHSREVIYFSGDDADEVPVGRVWRARTDGSGARRADRGNLARVSHFTWLAGTEDVLATLADGRVGLVRIGPDGEQRMICDGEHYWHAACSRDGRYAVSDTFIPDTGLALVHLRTGKSQTLCLSQSGNAHPPWSHPHPAISPDGRRVVFNSDREGTGHVYLAEIPEAMIADA